MWNSTKALPPGVERLGWIWGLFRRWTILDPSGEGEGGAEISNVDGWVDGGREYRREAGADKLSLHSHRPGEGVHWVASYAGVGS